MLRPRIVVTRPLVGRWREVLDPVADVDVVGGASGPDPGALREALADADALICLLTDPVDDALLAAGPKLRVVANYAVGLDNIDVAAAQRRGVLVCNTPNLLTAATADLAFALLLCVSRRIVEGDALVRAGAFAGWRPDLLLGGTLDGRRLGILGYGRIGRAMATRGRAFGLETVYWSRSEVTDDVAESTRLPLDTVLSTSDFLSLHLPLTNSTYRLLGAEQLALMKPTAYLINTARGPVVDEAALAEQLHAGMLAGAGLDVFEEEPAIHPRLMSAPNVVMAPHVGSATVETRHRMAEALCEDVVRVLTGGVPECVVGV